MTSDIDERGLHEFNRIMGVCRKCGLHASKVATDPCIPTSEPADKRAQFKRGDRVRKIRGSSWQGVIVGDYSTSLTPMGWCVESEREPGSVQLYPEAALELVLESSNTAMAQPQDRTNAHP